MGHAADFALGIALAKPDKKVIVLNGDGSMLMCLGTLATIKLSAFRLDRRTYEVPAINRYPLAMQVSVGPQLREVSVLSRFMNLTIQTHSMKHSDDWNETGPTEPKD